LILKNQYHLAYRSLEGFSKFILPRKNARKINLEDRDKARSEIKGLGGDELGRKLWVKLTGYSRRALVESSFSRLKRLFGSHLYSRKTSTL